MTSKMHFELEILPQPDQFTCGPTCLHAVYRYFGDSVSSCRQVVDEIPQLEDGGTLAVVMACHALARGYQATIYTYNVQRLRSDLVLAGLRPAGRAAGEAQEKAADVEAGEAGLPGISGLSPLGR